MREGFLILSSGNFTDGGHRKNFELGYITYSSTNLTTFFEEFEGLKSKADLDSFANQIEYYQNLVEVTNAKTILLSAGTFYHKWNKDIKWRLRLDLSEKELERLNAIQEEEGQTRYGGFNNERSKSLSRDPIEIKNFLRCFPNQFHITFGETTV